MDFAFLCGFLEKMEHLRKRPLQLPHSRELLKRLLAAARRHGDLYAVMRLLIPKRDIDRQHYNMKESALAVILMQALGIAADSTDGLLLSNWKRTDNFAAGDFTQIASQVISKRQCQTSSQLSIVRVNVMLDKLAENNKRKARVDLFRELIENTTTVEIKWFIRIVLKDMRIGLGENSILDILHEDAREMMATCVDLKAVCSQLYDQSAQPFRKELIVGKALKSQHSKRMNSVEATWQAVLTLTSIHKAREPMSLINYRAIMNGHLMAKIYVSMLDAEVAAAK